MSRKKEYFMVIDAETCNTLEQPLCYDIGYAVCDRQGNIVKENSFIVAEIFLDLKDTMKSAYYAKKLPNYWKDIEEGTRQIKTLRTIRKIILEDIKKYKIRRVGAYNMGFDRKALNTTWRYVTKSFTRYFFPYGTDLFCIWNMACQTILQQKTYIKFAMQNDLVSNANNIITSAEACYKYITKQLDFTESHTGLEDVKIEVEIMAKCFAAHKKMEMKPKANCWQIPQKIKKSMAEV